LHCHHNKGNNVIVMTAKMSGLQRHLHIDDGNTIATRATTPAQQQEDTFALMTATIPLLQGQ
jgi:hypothetical protein